MTVDKPLPPWKPPRAKPELQPATDEQAREYIENPDLTMFSAQTAPSLIYV